MHVYFDKKRRFKSVVFNLLFTNEWPWMFQKSFRWITTTKNYHRQRVLYTDFHYGLTIQFVVISSCIKSNFNGKLNLLFIIIELLTTNHNQWYICTYFQTPSLLILIRYTLKKTQAVTNQIKACSSAFLESFRLKLGDCKSVWVLKYTDIRQIVNYCVVLLIKGFFW